MKSKIKALFRRKTLRNSFWLIAERIYQAAISFILTVLTSRYLGPSGFGVLDYGATLTSFFAVIMKLGLDNTIVNELINNRKKEGSILGTAVILRLLSALLSIVTIIILVFVLQYNSWLIIATSILQSLVLLFQAATILDGWFLSRLESKSISVAKGLAYTAMALYKGYLLFSGKGIIWFAASTIIEYMLIAFFILGFYKKSGGKKLTFDKNIGKNLIKNSHHYIISGILVLVYTQMDKIMIGTMLNETQLGLYSAALKICTIWTFIPEAVISTARTVVLGLKSNKENYVRRLKQTYAIVFWGCSLASLIILACSNLIVGLIYGDAYYASAQTLRILILFVPFSQLGTVRNIWMVAENKSKYAKKFAIWGVCFNLTMNTILIRVMGITGAALATVLTEIATCFIAPLVYKDARECLRIMLKGIAFKWN